MYEVSEGDSILYFEVSRAAFDDGAPVGYKFPARESSSLYGRVEAIPRLGGVGVGRSGPNAE